MRISHALVAVVALLMILSTSSARELQGWEGWCQKAVIIDERTPKEDKIMCKAGEIPCPITCSDPTYCTCKYSSADEGRVISVMLDGWCRNGRIVKDTTDGSWINAIVCKKQ